MLLIDVVCLAAALVNLVRMIVFKDWGSVVIVCYAVTHATLHHPTRMNKVALSTTTTDVILMLYLLTLVNNV